MDSLNIWVESPLRDRKQFAAPKNTLVGVFKHELQEAFNISNVTIIYTLFYEGVELSIKKQLVNASLT